jgi:hypothetical protein
MDGICIYIWVILFANVGKYSSTIEHMSNLSYRSYVIPFITVSWALTVDDSPIKTSTYRVRLIPEITYRVIVKDHDCDAFDTHILGGSPAHLL